MASPSTVITRGYGTWGTVNEVVTLGYGIGAFATIVGAWSNVIALHSINQRMDIYPTNARMDIKTNNERLEL